MKHNSHVYVASKAIELMYVALYNLRYTNGRKVKNDKAEKMRAKAKILRRFLEYHRDRITEAAWAPDDVLNDKSQYHTFKLFTASEFTDWKKFAKEPHKKGNKTYYRISGGGGLAYKIDHLAKIINNIMKLRNYNDSYTMEHVMYMYLLLSHYVVDAHVPMHCDIRDDKPAKNAKNKPVGGKYYKNSWHGTIEDKWEKACSPVGFYEEMEGLEHPQNYIKMTDMSERVTFRIDNDEHIDAIRTYSVKDDDLMDFVIDICIKSKERSMDLFPQQNPDNVDMDKLNSMTGDIFSDAIGNLISIWVCMWTC